MTIKSKIAKAEAQITDLAKMDSTLKEHLGRIRQFAPDSARVIANKLFVDHMVPGVGNKAAYEDFLSRPRAGVHMELDGNDFGSINKQHTMAVGDQAIKAMGGAIRNAARKHRMKCWRVGGDEFKLHADTPEQAYGFARTLKQHLDQLPPAGGTHKHSVSLGMGTNPEQAGVALLHAKHAKKAAGKLPGQADTHAHSLLPGAAGTVPVVPDHPDAFIPPK